MFLKILKNPESLFKWSFRPQVCNFIKKESLLAQAFSCVFCEMFKNTFFTEHLRTTAAKAKNVSHMMGLVFRIFIIKITKNISKNTTFWWKLLQNKKQNIQKTFILFFQKRLQVQGRRHQGVPMGLGPLTFLRSKKKKWKQRGKKGFKTETIKSLSPTLKCYCFSHSRACRIQKRFLWANHGWQYFSVFHGSFTLKSISPAL